MTTLIGKILKLPKCENIIVVPIRYSGGGYVCIDIRDNKGNIGSDESYIREDGFDDCVDLTPIVKNL